MIETLCMRKDSFYRGADGWHEITMWDKIHVVILSNIQFHIIINNFVDQYDVSQFVLALLDHAEQRRSAQGGEQHGVGAVGWIHRQYILN